MEVGVPDPLFFEAIRVAIEVCFVCAAEVLLALPSHESIHIPAGLDVGFFLLPLGPLAPAKVGGIQRGCGSADLFSAGCVDHLGSLVARKALGPFADPLLAICDGLGAVVDGLVEGNQFGGSFLGMVMNVPHRLFTAADALEISQEPRLTAIRLPFSQCRRII